MDIFVGECYDSKPTGKLTKHEIDSFEDFCNRYLSTCLKGGKNEYYITIGDCYEITKADPSAPLGSYKSEDHYHRNNKTHVSSWLLPFDGDSSLSDKDSCISASTVHLSLKKLGYNHVIYTTHSHNPPHKLRWRLFIPCQMSSKLQLKPTSDYLYKILATNGCEDLKMSNESRTLSIPWYLPTRDNPEDGYFEYYSYFKGRSFIPLDGQIESGESLTYSPEKVNGRSVDDMLKIIKEGQANSGLHEATRDFAVGQIRDGVQPGAVKAILHAMTTDYSMSDPRQKENKEKINALVDSAALKHKVGVSVETEQDWNEGSDDRVYTKYPNQGGMMEHLVDTCMKHMMYPNRQIAVTACHTLISTLGGRVYTLDSGSGIVLTALITGRSTIGKSSIKKFCTFALNNFSLGNKSQDFIGSHFYTSSNNLVKELTQAGSLLTIRTESGQSDKSTAGDMNRVMIYELELATESGRDGYVSSGGQNDKIPCLYSPAVTTVRESVAQIQDEADMLNAASISGTTGRRSHIIIDPIKGPCNKEPIRELTNEAKKVLNEIYKLASDERRSKVEDPLPPKLWITVGYKNPKTIWKKMEIWRERENKAAKHDMHFDSTFYGRLGQRVPAYAARLAICDNPKAPLINDFHIDVAEKSLIAEYEAHKGQRASGELGSPWERLTKRIIDIFRGDMTKKKTLRTCGLPMLKDGACEWTKIANMLKHHDEYKILNNRSGFLRDLTERLEAADIILLKKEDTKQLYKKRSRIYKRR